LIFKRKQTSVLKDNGHRNLSRRREDKSDREVAGLQREFATHVPYANGRRAITF
jgi:hypothetical protein